MVNQNLQNIFQCSFVPPECEGGSRSVGKNLGFWTRPDKTRHWFTCYSGKHHYEGKVIGRKMFTFGEAFMAASTPCIMIAAGPCVCVFLCCWWCLRPARDRPIQRNRSYTNMKETEMKDITTGLRATVGAFAGNARNVNNVNAVIEERNEEERERAKEQEIRDENEAHLKEFLMDHM